MSNLGVECNEEEVEEIIKEADTEGNGNINYHEFLKLMTLWEVAINKAPINN